MLLYFSMRALILQSTSTKWLASAHPPHSTGSCTRISGVRPLHILSSCLFCHWTRVQNMIASWLGVHAMTSNLPGWLLSLSFMDCLRSISKRCTNTVLMSETTCSFYFLGDLTQSCGVTCQWLADDQGGALLQRAPRSQGPELSSGTCQHSAESLSNFILVCFSNSNRAGETPVTCGLPPFLITVSICGVW